ncbi:MAG TPA: ATP-binding protein [Sphingomonas sp.]|jgi:hypothetical protein|uniref:ATP-binding protein n=1 Tax=Sphingomonas sp. TaxID=28214 RepID=UPI002ED92246
MSNIGKANANASRAFFVRMLTRDISVEDCILDLVDNSVDSAWKALGKKPLTISDGPDFSKTAINLKFDDESFEIVDNGGGMSLDSATKYAFTFGRQARDPEDNAEFSIGVYGIGLKRAVFKIGTKISVRSTHTADGVRDAFVVPINVKRWVEGTSTNWDFPIESADPMREDGLMIEVGGLTDLAALTFADPEFQRSLKRTIGRDYALHIRRGLTIRVNGEKVVGEDFKLIASDQFAPQYLKWKEVVGGSDVFVEMAAGFAFPPPSDNEPSDKGNREDRSGWYVACNGRIVMAADKTYLSVWGDDFPSWHPQYTGFFGLIVFTADDTELLPLTTTKRSVDLSSVVYRRARAKMRESTRAWITYTHERKADQQTADRVEKEAGRTSIFAIKPRAQVALPSVQKTRQRESSIQFMALKTRIVELAKALGNVNMSNKDVGIAAFDYAYDELVQGE